MDANDIRVWCMQNPRPSVVRVTNADGQQQEVVVQGQWTKLADTLATLQPELLEALNADKQLIRAIAPNDLSEDWEPDERPRATSARRTSSGESAGSFVGIPIPVSDPETARFVLMGKLLADAYKDANTARDAAFQHLVDIVNSAHKRSESVERAKDALHKLEIQRLRQQVEAAGQEPAPSPEGELTLQNLLGVLLQGMGAGQAADAGERVPNGKAS